jgi:FkbH-like protein
MAHARRRWGPTGASQPNLEGGAGNPGTFRIPDELSVAPDGLTDVLVIGECVAAWLAEGAACFGRRHDFVLLNNYSTLPERPPRPLTTYGFQFVQIPLRTVLPEWEYLLLPFNEAHLWQQLYETSCHRLERIFDEAVRYNTESDLLTFVAGFLVPQQNPMGRLLPRNDLRNLVFMVESLNRHLVGLVENRRNAYYFDVDQIAAGLGKQFIQDDSLTASTHGSFLSDFDSVRDVDRLESPGRESEFFDIRTDAFREAVWVELLALSRTVEGVDQVKLVLVDLDDTLWRGVVAETNDVSDDTTEGWPMGVIEALQFLKKRGVLLGIISKNDASTIEAVWPTIFRGRLDLGDFAVRKINWRPKPDNLEEILDEVNLLSRNVVFVDDNPAEREAIATAFPDVRVIGADLYRLRRILMWASETQVAFVSEESSGRTQTVQGQVARERERKKVPRQEFLRGLAIEAHLFEVDLGDEARVNRSIELLSRTNQFNTTGRRWTAEEVRALSDGSMRMIGFEVRDKFTDYGMVGVIVLHQDAGGLRIEQMVMSCRVFGLDVELAVLVEVAACATQASTPDVTGVIRKQKANQPCWDVFERLGFHEESEGIWTAPGLTPPRELSVAVRWRD